MPASFLVHVTILVFSAIGSFIWTSNPTLSLYTLQLVAALTLLYFAAHFLQKKRPRGATRSILTLDLVILTIILLLLITQTGALDSPFFFTTYFLLFAVSLLFEIETTLILTGVLITFFTLSPTTDITNTLHLSHLISLIAVLPLAIFTAHEYERALEEKRLRALAQQHISTEETDTMLFLSLNLKKTLIATLDQLSQTIPQAKVKEVRQNLTLLYQDLKNLYHSADELQEIIDKETDDQSVE